MLEKIACPSCGTPLDLKLTAAGAQIRCDACGSVFLLKGHVCPYCGTYHEQDSDFCRQCGRPLSRRCPHCQTVNWIGDEYCMHCGSALDILEMVVQRHNETTQERLDAQQDEIRQLKAAEEVASQERLVRLREKDRQREEETRRRLLEQQEREKQILMYVFVGGAVLVTMLILFTLLAT